MKSCQWAKMSAEQSTSVGMDLPEEEQVSPPLLSCLYLLPIRIVLQSLCIPGRGWGGSCWFATAG